MEASQWRRVSVALLRVLWPLADYFQDVTAGDARVSL